MPWARAVKLFRAGAFAAAAFALLGCGQTQRLYDGPKRDADEVAVLRNGETVFVRYVDGREVAVEEGATSWLGRDYHLLPGRHRVEVLEETASVSGSPLTGSTIYQTRAYNLWTLRHDFKGGERYELGSHTVLVPDAARPPGNSPETLSLVALFEMDGKEPVALPVLAPDPPRDPPRGRTLAGQAANERYTATGRLVFLVRDTPAARAWAKKPRMAERAARDLKRMLPPGEFAEAREVVGYGLGYFEFPDVPPGEWLVCFPVPGDVFEPELFGEVKRETAAVTRVRVDADEPPGETWVPVGPAAFPARPTEPPPPPQLAAATPQP